MGNREIWYDMWNKTNQEILEGLVRGYPVVSTKKIPDQTQRYVDRWMCTGSGSSLGSNPDICLNNQ
jgi:hypothetical protein